MSPCRIIATVRSRTIARASWRRRGRVGPLLKIDEGRQLEKPLSVAAVPFESLAVGPGHDENRVGAVERRLGAGMRRRPGAARALAGARGLRHDIGNAQGVGDPRADPIRRLVVQMIGEPEARPIAGASVRPARDEAIRFGRCCCGALHPGRLRRRPGPSCAARLRAPARKPASTSAFRSRRAMVRSPEGAGWSGAFIGA